MFPVIGKNLVQELSRTSATTLSKAVQLPQTRTFVNQAILAALTKSPLAEAVKDNYRFQENGACVATSMKIRDGIEKQLEARGLLKKVPPDGKTAAAIAAFENRANQGDTRHPGLEIKERPTSNEIAALNKQHGPVTLIMQHAVSVYDGAHIYRQHHAVSLVASFQCGGRNIGIIIDPNDLQDNPGVQKAMEFAGKKYGKSSHHGLAQLTKDDLAQLSRETNGEFDQVKYTLADLDKMVNSSNRKLDVLHEVQRENQALAQVPVQTNQVRYNPRASIQQNVLPISVETELKAQIQLDPSIVETFERAPEELREHTEMVTLWDGKEVSTTAKLNARLLAPGSSTEPYTFEEWETFAKAEQTSSATSYPAISKAGRWQQVTSEEQLAKALYSEPAFAELLNSKDETEWIGKLMEVINQKTEQMTDGDNGLALVFRFAATSMTNNHIALASLWRDANTGELVMKVLRAKGDNWKGEVRGTFDTSATYPTGGAPVAKALKPAKLPDVSLFPCPYPERIDAAIAQYAGADKANPYGPTENWSPKDGLDGKAHQTRFNVIHKGLAHVMGEKAESKPPMLDILRCVQRYASSGKKFQNIGGNGDDNKS